MCSRNLLRLNICIRQIDLCRSLIRRLPLQHGNGAGLSVTTAALDFDLDSAAAAAIVDELAVPVVATVTTTPAVVVLPTGGNVVAVGAVSAVGIASRAVSIAQPIKSLGLGANAPNLNKPSPVTVQVGLSASVPQEALSGTGITSVEIGTAFPEQPLGSRGST